MDKEDITLLRLMEEVENNSYSSQRELARKLNVSLGLVNSFIKRLVNKGYFKITSLPKNRVRYLLTPKGVAQKGRLTVEYLRYSVNFYRSAKELLLETFRQMEKNHIKRIIFYGAGEVAELAYLYLQLTTLELIALIDTEKFGQRFFSFKIEGVERLVQKDWDAILVTRLDKAQDIVCALTERGIPPERIVTL